MTHVKSNLNRTKTFLLGASLGLMMASQASAAHDNMWTDGTNNYATGSLAAHSATTTAGGLISADTDLYLTQGAGAAAVLPAQDFDLAVGKSLTFHLDHKTGAAIDTAEVGTNATGVYLLGNTSKVSIMDAFETGVASTGAQFRMRAQADVTYKGNVVLDILTPAHIILHWDDALYPAQIKLCPGSHITFATNLTPLIGAIITESSVPRPIKFAAITQLGDDTHTCLIQGSAQFTAPALATVFGKGRNRGNADNSWVLSGNVTFSDASIFSSGKQDTGANNYTYIGSTASKFNGIFNVSGASVVRSTGGGEFTIEELRQEANLTLGGVAAEDITVNKYSRTAGNLDINTTGEARIKKGTLSVAPTLTAGSITVG